jgi:hypothetical protein
MPEASFEKRRPCCATSEDSQGKWLMTVADGTLVVFTLFNGLRFLAYVPQIAKSLRDQSGAEAMSFGTWWLFLLSHASAMAYAIENQGDWKMATLFLSNAVGCAAVLMIAAWKRASYRRRAIETLEPRARRAIQAWDGAVSRGDAILHGGVCRSGPGSRDGPEPRPRRRDSHWPESLKP